MSFLYLVIISIWWGNLFLWLMSRDVASALHNKNNATHRTFIIIIITGS